MDTSTVLNLFQEVFGATFGIDGTKISREMTAKDVKGWDSVDHDAGDCH